MCGRTLKGGPVWRGFLREKKSQYYGGAQFSGVLFAGPVWRAGMVIRPVIISPLTPCWVMRQEPFKFERHAYISYSVAVLNTMWWESRSGLVAK